MAFFLLLDSSGSGRRPRRGSEQSPRRYLSFIKGRTIMNEFRGKVAIVTGGTSGIGRAAAVAYAREGAKVVVAGRRAAEGEETVRLLQAQGGEGIFVATDVSKEAQVKQLVERTMQKFGRLDFAFNNAGIEQEPTPFLEQDEETYDRVMDINVKGVWLSMKYEIPAMLKTGGGSIVNTSSGLGVIAIPGVEIYVASKHAVIGLTKSAALEFGKQGIRVNAILPAVIETEMFQRFAGEKPEFRAQMTALHPIGRIGKSEEIADAAIWLSSSKSSFVTGHSLLVDGGFTAQ
ncbi:MAG TPA: SDR family oxidoreductase [Chloroflexota bacterium]|nr:SDR family oxidoreductase [Chloroflexota bacterium]